MAIGATGTASRGIDFFCAIAGPQRDLERARQLLLGASPEDPVAQVLRMLEARPLSAAYLTRKLPLADKAIKSLERRIVDLVSSLLLQLDNQGKIVKRTKKVYAMMLFGTLNFSHTWYDPDGGIGPAEFADMVVDQFLHGIADHAAPKAIRAAPRS